MIAFYVIGGWLLCVGLSILLRPEWAFEEYGDGTLDFSAIHPTVLGMLGAAPIVLARERERIELEQETARLLREAGLDDPRALLREVGL